MQASVCYQFSILLINVSLTQGSEGEAGDTGLTGDRGAKVSNLNRTP